MTGDAGAITRPERWPWSLALLLALPLLGLVMLLASPELDAQWEHHPSHFWLVLGTAAVSVALAYVTNAAAVRHHDARLLLVSLVFLASAGFLGLHALATPGVLLPSPNTGFVIATPVGLVIASFFAVASVSPLAGPRSTLVLRHHRALLWGLVAVMVGWGVVSLAGLPPLNGPLPSQEAVGPLAAFAVLGVALFGIAAWRYVELYRRRRGLVLLTMAVAMVLLAEAMVAVALSRNWHVSWWEWHLLMLIAFAAIALGARREYQRSGSLTGAFGGLYLEATLARIDRWHAGAIAAVANAQERGESTDRVLSDLRREGASEDEVELLAGAARELRRLDAAFRPYLPAPVARRVGEGPAAARLGGQERTVSVLFADLAGFTAFSESRRPTDVLEMLNRFWGAVVPEIDAAGGVVEHFAGDGVMVIFNADGDQRDHAMRAARAGTAIVAAARTIADANPGWPTFRVGINTGRAVVGDIGAAGRRSFAVIGDTTNVASRLMATGEPGQVIVAGTTWAALERAEGSALGRIRVKGKRTPVEAWILRRLDA